MCVSVEISPKPTMCRMEFSKDGVVDDRLKDYETKFGKKLKTWEYNIVMVPSGASTVFAINYKRDQLGHRNSALTFGEAGGWAPVAFLYLVTSIAWVSNFGGFILFTTAAF